MEESRRIEVRAAKALVHWKTQFETELSKEAQRIAANEKSELVTFEHYQQAAETAIKILATTIHDVPEHVSQKAA